MGLHYESDTRPCHYKGEQFCFTTHFSHDALSITGPHVSPKCPWTKTFKSMSQVKSSLFQMDFSVIVSVSWKANATHMFRPYRYKL